MSLRVERSSWSRVRFGDVVANVNDYYSPERDGILPYVAGPHIVEGQPTVTSYGSTDEDNFPPTFKRKFRSSDVLLHSRGIEKLAAVDRAGVTGEKLFVLRSTDESKLLQDFLPWLLMAPAAQRHMMDNFTGSVNKFLNWRPLAGFEFGLPPLDQQKRIADLLWAVEDHRKSLATSPDVLADVYDAWLEERLSRAPKRPLADEVRLLNGRPVPSSLYGEGEFALLRPGDMKSDGSVAWTAASVGIPSDFAEKYSEWILEPGDVVINMTAQSLEDRFLGRVCKMQDRALLNQRIGRLTSTGSISMEYAYVALRSVSFSKWVAQRSEGSKVKHMHWRHIADFPLPVPTEAEQTSIVSEAKEWSEAMRRSGAESETIERLRHSILNGIFGGS